jgi:hypothetical protein
MMKTGVLVCLALLSSIPTWDCAAADRGYSLEGVNDHGDVVVYDMSPGKACEVGKNEAWIFHAEGGKVKRLWSEQRCMIETGSSKTLELTCVSNDPNEPSFSDAVFTRSSKDGGDCEYVCSSGCLPHVPKTLRQVESAAFAPPDQPPAARADRFASRATVVLRPSFSTITDAYGKTGFKSLSLRVLLDYDDRGRVVRASLSKTSGNEALDAAIIEWAMKLELSPGKAGSGSLPFEFTSE